MQQPHRHAKTDSEATFSMAAYYVQSPGHDDKTAAAPSFHSSSSSRRGAAGGGTVDEGAGHRGGRAPRGRRRRVPPRLGDPQAVESVTFHKFVVQAGADASLVPTEMSTLNATLKLTFRNTGSFFGVHVTAQPVTLNYYQLVLASGDVKYFYQSRKSQRSLKVAVVGDKVPLYGGGSELSSTSTTLPPKKKKMPPVVVPPPPVPLKLTVRLRSRAFVLGKLVKPKFYTEVHCSVTMDQTKMGKAVRLNKGCTYTD